MGPTGTGTAAPAGGSARVSPTARGLGVAAFCVVSAAGGRLLGYPELTALAAGALAALLLAAGWLAGGQRLAVSRQVAPAQVQRGDAAVAALRVANRGRRATRPLTVLDRVGAVPVRVQLPALGPGAASRAGYRLPTGRRGRLAVGPLLLRADDPFGLLRRVLVYGEGTSVLVRPQTAPLVPPAAGRRASLDGPYSENAPSGNAVFHTLREYVPGDDLRHVHWRTTARTDTLMIRQLVDTALPETVIVLDTRASSYPPPSAAADDFDLAVDAAATIAAGMARAGFPAAILTSGGGRFRAGGPHSVPVLLDRLAELTTDPASGPDSGPALGRAIERARRSGAARGGFALVTGALSELPAGPLASVRVHFERMVLMRASAGVPGRPAGPRAEPGGLTAVTVAGAREAAAAWQGGGRR